MKYSESWTRGQLKLRNYSLGQIERDLGINSSGFVSRVISGQKSSQRVWERIDWILKNIPPAKKRSKRKTK